MEIHKLLQQAEIKGVKTLYFDWADREVAVPIGRLARAVENNVGMDIDEHERQDWIDATEEWLDQMRRGDEYEQLIAHLVWCLNLSRKWSEYATDVIYKAVALALATGN